MTGGAGDVDGVARPANPLSLATLASSPKGTPLGCAENFASTTEAVPLDRLSPAGERCRVSDRVGSGWHRVSDDGRGRLSRKAHGGQNV